MQSPAAATATAATQAAPPHPAVPAYPALVGAYDRRTRAAYEVMGARWGRFLEAKASFDAAAPGSREWYLAAERAYRHGLRSTHAYYLWTCGHTALVLRLAGSAAADAGLRLALGRELQGPACPAGR
jgi:cytosine/adenosine deaminase-related metal-dependent hydrolase